MTTPEYGELGGQRISLDADTIAALDEGTRAQIVVTLPGVGKLHPYRFGSFGGQTFILPDGKRRFSVGG